MKQIMRLSFKAIGAFAAGIPFLLAGTGNHAPSAGLPCRENSYQRQKSLQYEVSVVLHLIQVYVTDKKGNAVPDLTKDDFTVHDNGSPVEITEFETRLIAPPGGAARPETPPKTGNLPAQAGLETAGREGPAREPGMTRKFVLLLDFAFNDLRGVRKAKEAALHFLDREVKPGDELGLFSYSLTRGLSIHEFLTSDQDKVRKALELLDLHRIAGRAEAMEREYWLAGFEDRTSTEPGGVGGQPPNERNPANLAWRRQESKNQALNYVHKLATLAKALRYVPGQKHLLLFTQGISGSLMYATQEGVETKGKFDAGDFILRTAYEDMLKELSSAGCRIFAFDTREAAKLPALFDYDEQTFGLLRGAGRFMFTQSGVAQNPNLIYTDDKFTGMYALTKLSKDTGGLYYSNINEYERNLGQLQSVTGAFYVIGYPVKETWDGRFHEIKVDVKRKGLRVNAPRGFYDSLPFKELTPLEKELSLFDLALSEQPVFQAPLAAEMTALSAPFSPIMNLSFVTLIPQETLAGLAGREVEIVSLAFDENENLADLRRAVFDLTRLGDKPVIFASGGSLKPGSYKCRVVVRNLETGWAAVASSRAFIPQPLTAGIRLHSILWLRPGGEAGYLEAAEGAGGRVSEPSSTWASLYAFNRSLFTPAIGPVPSDTPRMQGAVPCSFAGIPEPLIALNGFLVDMATGERTPAPITLHDRLVMDDMFVQSIEVGLAGVPPGSYVLYLNAEEKTTKANAHVTAALTLR